MRARFQADADFNQKIVAGLRRREPTIDRQTMPGHFRRLIEKQASPGLVIVSQELDIGRAIEELLLVWAASEAEEWENAVIFLPL